jgi:nuclear pore complex protein Nup205
MEGAPAAATSSALIARRLAEATKGAAAATGGLSPPVAAAAAARMERSLRAVRAALVSAQLALAEQGRAVVDNKYSNQIGAKPPFRATAHT